MSQRDVVDTSGTVQDAINYDAYGNIQSGETNPGYRGWYAWSGQEFDVQTDLQYNNARWYDATTGRWISQDPLGFDAGDSNLYRYVNNAPTDHSDPSGLEVFVVLTDLSSGVKGHGQIWVTNKDKTEAYTYDGVGPGESVGAFLGRVAGFSQMVLGSTDAFYLNLVPKTGGPYSADEIKEKLKNVNPKSIVVISNGDYKTEKAALDKAYKDTKQIPIYNTLEMNSNTWAMAMLANAKKQLPTLDTGKLSLIGGKNLNPRDWGYGGKYFDKQGEPTKELFEFLKKLAATQPLPTQPEKQREKEAAMRLKVILDARGKKK